MAINMPLAGWWDRRQAQWREGRRLADMQRQEDKRLAKAQRRREGRLAEIRAARAAADEFDRLRTTRIETGRGGRFLPTTFIDHLAVAEGHDQVARLTEEAARLEADRDREFTWTWRCKWAEASEQATQRIGAARVGRDRSTMLYQVAHYRVFNEAVRDRRLVEYANGWAEPFLILQSVPPEIAAFLIGACYGRYSELLDEADEWPDTERLPG